MLLSKYFLPLLKDDPTDAVVKSHILMLRSGMIRQHSSGIYNWLPLGLKVLQNVQNIVRSNMDKIGCIEILMPCVQDSDIWVQSGRYDKYGREMLKFKDRHDHELLFGPTCEELITDLVKNSIQSYRNVPLILYQIQSKFRDEIRPRFGVMRGREFLMKDAYSFDMTVQDSINTYDMMFKTYMSIFQDIGLSVIPVVGDPGEIGGNLNHEFHVIADSGETELYYDKQFDSMSDELRQDVTVMRSIYAATGEIYDSDNCPISKQELSIRRGIEVGQIFNFADKYSSVMKAFLSDQNGKQTPMQMGSYGIGISRIVAAIIETSHDDKGIIWPQSIAPFKISLINLKMSDDKCRNIANKIYESFISRNIDVLYDDTNQSVGSKFATHDLIGSPWQIIIGSEFIQNDLIELKCRATSQIEKISADSVVEKMIDNFLN